MAANRDTQAAKTVLPEDRRIRHRQTEILRRQRINTAVAGLREEVDLPSQIDQATVLEHALRLIKDLKRELLESSSNGMPPTKRPACSTGSVDEGSSSASSESGTTCTQDQISLTEGELEVGVNTFLSQLIHSTTTQAAPPLVATTGFSTSTQPALADFAFSTSSSPKMSLDSMFLPLNVGLFIVSSTGHVLDCNQAALTMGGASDLHQYNDHRDWRESNLIVELDVDLAAFEQLQKAGAISTHQLARRIDGTLQWERHLATRMDDQRQPVNANTTFFGVCQLASAPQDGRSRVWSSEHLVHVGFKQHPICSTTATVLSC